MKGEVALAATPGFPYLHMLLSTALPPYRKLRGCVKFGHPYGA